MGVSVLPSPTRSQSDATPRARTSSPAGRLPPSAVPPAGGAPLRRGPLGGVPRRGRPRDQAPLEGSDLHAAGDPLGLPRPGPRRRPVLSRRGSPPDRVSRLARTQAL